MKLTLKITFLLLTTICWLSLHYFKNNSLFQAPTAVKQQLLDEVATARIQLAAASTAPVFLSTCPPHLFVFTQEKQIYWSDNRTPVSDSLLQLSPGFVALENGIYLLHKKTGDTTILYLKLIQEIPRVRNRYIEPFRMFNGELSLTPAPGFQQLDLGQQKIYFLPIPFSLSSFQLFNPEFYASSQLNPSLGFLLLNLILLGSICIVVFDILIKRNTQLSWWITLLLFFGLGPMCTETLISLVDDSKLNLEFFNFNSLTSIDLIIPLILVWFSVIFFVVSTTYFRNTNSLKKLPYLVVTVLVYNLIQYAFGRYDLLEINGFLPILFLPFLPLTNYQSSFSWQKITVLLTLAFGWYFVLQKHQLHHLKDEEILIAEKLLVNDDPVAEYLITEGLSQLEMRYRQQTDTGVNTLAFLEENLFLGYLSKYTAVALPDSADLEGAFYFSFQSNNYRLQNRYSTTGFGFPELLANREFVNYYEKGYSTARFSKNRLLQSTGSYEYQKNLPATYQNNTFLQRSENLHYVKKLRDEIIVVSYPIKTPLHNFATATYLFVIATIGALPWLVKKPRQLSSLQTRIQVTFLSLVILTVVIFGASTYLYLSDQFAEKNKLTLSEKIRSVETELISKVKMQAPWEKQTVENQLRKLAEIFFTDISLYDTSGKLIASSQPDVFSKGVLSRQMEPEAYRRLHDSGSNLVIQTESIGKLSYLSAYRPLSNARNQTVAYINLPYFAKQLELNKELSNFLVSTITALVLLTAIALALAIFLASRITEPLKLIRLKLQAIDLKKENQQIDYPSQDEIGELVSAYNNKVKELIEKANQLAKSERESAWREMARQVAHEIKNPLTPIKLNAQLLQRNLEGNDPDIQAKTKKFVAGLIDQVNTLAKIANEFSNYASLPKTIETEVNLTLILENALSVMINDQIDLVVELPEEPCVVLADKDLLLRVINNLLKNAQHAIEEKTFPANEKGLITIRLVAQGSKALLSLKDNGIGISEEMRDKIFSPNFTTKSGGMGLGLAMVKQIIEQNLGKISFDSETGVGTEFHIQLPLIGGRNN